jgi:hypothetical protein
MHESIPLSRSGEINLEEQVAELLEQERIPFSYFEKFTHELRGGFVNNGEGIEHLFLPPQRLLDAHRSGKYPQLSRLVNLYYSSPLLQKYVQILRREPEPTPEELYSDRREKDLSAGTAKIREALRSLRLAGLNEEEILHLVDEELNKPEPDLS